MIYSKTVRRGAAVLSAAALAGVASWTGLARANTQPGPSGISVIARHVAVVEQPIHVNMRRGAEVTTTHLSVEVGGHTAWHYHPGPHVVAVAAGTVTVYETDCSVRGTFAKREGFFDPGSARPSDVHTLYNPGPEVAHVVITDFREPGGALTVAVDPQPTSECF